MKISRNIILAYSKCYKLIEKERRECEELNNITKSNLNFLSRATRESNMEMSNDSPLDKPTSIKHHPLQSINQAARALLFFSSFVD
jgi:hypothetical protein